MKIFKFKNLTAQGKPLLFPVFSILAVVATLLILLGISTYRHLHQYQFRMEESLQRDGKIILKTLEASFPRGMMGMMSRGDSIQDIMASIATLADIHFVALVDRQGMILTHSDERLIGTAFPQHEKMLQTSGSDGLASWFDDRSAFLVAKKMGATLFAGGRENIPGHMSSGMPMMRMEGSLSDRVLSGQVYAVVALDTKTFQEARANDLRHAMMMGVILLILGTGGFYFIFLIQNYYMVQRALNSVTVYLKHVVENMPDGLISMDPGGEIVTFNRRAGEILALTGKAPEKEEIKNKLHPFIAPILNSLKVKTPVLEYEVKIPASPEKTIPLALSAARLLSETGEDMGIVILLRDLREIKALQEEVKRSERMASLGTLAAGMAHEIRNPLSSIKGFAQYFLKKNPPGSDGQKYSEVIIQEVERLNRVISNLLDFARPKEPVFTTVSIAAVIRHTQDLIRDGAHSRHIEIRTQIDDGLPPIAADKDQITQVLLNILLNALDVVNAGGTLSIRALSNPGRKILEIEIEDDGPGMAAGELSKIFDPFYTTKKTGTGLGLAIAYRIIEKHHGTLSAKSAPGRGTLFHIELPFSEEGTGR